MSRAGAMGRDKNSSQTRCGCGKFGWITRKAAKRGARTLHPDERLSVYQCSHGGWHYGHLPNAVRHGDFDRTTLRRMRGQQ